jgi:mannose-6-phosphate isomerase-like protein (cupin superfamily)
MSVSRRSLNTTNLPEVPVAAPDGSTIRELLETDAASLVRCELPPGGVSLAVKHRTIVELWYFLEGQGEVWRKYDEGREELVAVLPGMCLRIPTGAAFQFRNTGAGSLAFLIVTMPPWPGEGEAVRVADHWPAAADGDPTL